MIGKRFHKLTAFLFALFINSISLFPLCADDNKLVGHWKTAEGDLIEIHKNSDGTFSGYFLVSSQQGLGKRFIISSLPLMLCTDSGTLKCAMQALSIGADRADELFVAKGDATGTVSPDGNQITLRWVPELWVEKSKGGLQLSLTFLRKEDPVEIVLIKNEELRSASGASEDEEP